MVKKIVRVPELSPSHVPENGQVVELPWDSQSANGSPAVRVAFGDDAHHEGRFDELPKRLALSFVSFGREFVVALIDVEQALPVSFQVEAADGDSIATI